MKTVKFSTFTQWVRRRPATLTLSVFLLAWFTAQLTVAEIVSVDASKWLFWSVKPDSWPVTEFSPGYFVAAFSHDIHNWTHITGNVIVLLLAGTVVEPRIGSKRVVSLVVVGGLFSVYGGYLIAPVFQAWPEGGVSGGVFALLAYNALRFRRVVKWRDVPSLVAEPERFVLWLIVMSLPVLIVEPVVMQNPGHFVGLLIGVGYYFRSRTE